MKSIINRIHSCTDQWFSKLGYAIAVVTILWPAQALATTGIGVLPWDAPLATIQGDLQGTVAHAATTIAVIGCGLTWTFSEHGTGARKMSAAALGATQLMTALFPFAPALF
ncbi:MAG: TrbC/VirB2 family protein [Candidatus Binataceae bacterium]|nr:TrbC/VirB2 family protein [Candidatus Binataceae bacterium]